MSTSTEIPVDLSGGRSEAPARTPGRSRRAGSVLAVSLMAVTLGLAGCGSSSSGTASTPVAQTSQGGGAAQSGNDTSDPLVKYSACMRANGAPSFPDPVNGRLQLQVKKGGDLDPASATFQAAQKACKSLEPAGIGTGAGPGGGNGQAQQDALLKFVACMRKNGVPNFPDPQADGRILLSPEVGDPGSPVFKSAQETCRKLLPGGVAPGGA
jgi:hypothetical protein